MLEHLIVDSGAIIKGCGYEFHKTSKRFWTVQDVINEIRDSKSLHLLETLPFELEIRVPSEAALRAVADFARKTGDFASLSLTDMRLLALTYQMEVEENGLKYIRAEPALTLRLAKAAKDASIKAKKAAAAAAVVAVSTSAGVSVVEGAEVAKEGDAAEEAMLVECAADTVDAESKEEDDEDDINSTHFDEVIEVEDVFGEMAIDSKNINSIKEGDEGEEEESEEEGEESEEESDDDEEESGDEEEEEEESDVKPVVATVDITPPAPAVQGDINFSEDFFPALSAEGPKRAKKAWPLPTNENIVRSPVPTSEEGTEKSSVPVVGWGAGSGTGTVAVKNWSSVAALSVVAAVATANDNNHTVANSAFNSTRDWSRKPKNYKKNNASMPAKIERTEEEVAEAAAAADGISVLPMKATVPFFPTMKAQSMPSRIIGSGGGGNSDLAAKKAAMEDDGAGWINPQNIQKYRSGVHISMVQFDKPSGRGNSGVHTDMKDAVTSDNINSLGSSGFNSMRGSSVSGSVRGDGTGGDTKSITSRQSNYKNTPTDAMRSMASMMMMGKNTITTSIPLEDWKDLKYSKTNSQTFFSTAGKTVKSEDLKKSENTENTENDSVEGAINNTQHLTISNNNKRNKGDKNESYAMKSACVTTDFSMQNVLMQMGLNVISVDGMLIRAAKQWVLRCMACFKVHYEMDRLFCSKCGANHLSRVGASVNAKTGELRLHLKANYVVNTLGTKYSIAKPGSRGRYEGELLLREDQLLSGIWRQKNVKIKKNVISFFGADVTSDVGIHVNKGQAIVVGMGKKNPNSQKGRERRGKSKK